MPISPDNIPRGAHQPSRSPKQILEELLALRHGDEPENANSIIDVLLSEADSDEEALSPAVGIMKRGIPEQIRKDLERKLKRLTGEFGGRDPHVVIRAMRDLADLLEDAQDNVDISPEKAAVVAGLADAVIPVIHSRQIVLKGEEGNLEKGDVEYDVDESPATNAVNQYLFGANPQDTVMEEQFIAFLRHAGELLTEWCDHPDIKAPLPKHVREHFLPEGGISSPPPG